MVSTYNISFVLTFLLGSVYDLIQKSGPISEATVARYTKQILTALCYLQDLKIVHRYPIIKRRILK